MKIIRFKSSTQEFRPSFPGEGPYWTADRISRLPSSKKSKNRVYALASRGDGRAFLFENHRFIASVEVRGTKRAWVADNGNFLFWETGYGNQRLAAFNKFGSPLLDIASSHLSFSVSRRTILVYQDYDNAAKRSKVGLYDLESNAFVFVVDAEIPPMPRITLNVKGRKVNLRAKRQGYTFDFSGNLIASFKARKRKKGTSGSSHR